MIRNSFFTVFLLTGFSSAAQQVLTLEEAIANALRNNYDILLAKNDSMAAAIDYSFRNAALLPRLNANIGTLWNNNAQKQILFDGTERKKSGIKSNNVNAQLAMNWTLFDGMKMFATRDKLAEFVRLGELGIKTQLINTVAAVINNYYDIVRQKQHLKAVEEQMDLSRERLKMAEYKLDIGVGTKPDVLQAKVDLNAQRATQIQQQTLILQLKERLNQLMSVPVSKDGLRQSVLYDVTDSIPINMILSLGEIQSSMEVKNPSLLLAKKNIDIANIVLRERRAERFPVVSFNSAYNFNRTNNQTVINSFSTLYNRSNGLNYGLTATIPILNNFNSRRLIRQAELDISYQQLIYDNQRSVLTLALINAYHDYEQQKRALTLEEESIVLARENVNILFQVYRLNSTTIIQLKEAEKSLADAYNRLITARYTTKLAETELLRLRGDLVK